MYVVIWVFWRIHLQDEMNVLEIDSTGNNVSSKQHATVSAQKLINDSFSSFAFEFAVDAGDAIVALEIRGEYLQIIVDTCAST